MLKAERLLAEANKIRRNGDSTLYFETIQIYGEAASYFGERRAWELHVRCLLEQAYIASLYLETHPELKNTVNQSVQRAKHVIGMLDLSISIPTQILELVSE